jgi:hypothetical protein
VALRTRRALRTIVKPVRQRRSFEGKTSLINHKKNWEAVCSRVAPRGDAVGRLSAIKRLREAIAQEQRQIQTLEGASVLSVARVILHFMEDLPKLQKLYLDRAS